MPRIAVVVGNPKAGSRTAALGDEVARQIHALTGGGGHDTEQDVVTIELAGHTGELFDWTSSVVAGLVDAVIAADLVVVASPTYKATYTGLLKVFLDRFAAGALGGRPAVPVMTGGSLRHALAVDHALRPLLVEIGASVPTVGLYVTEAELLEPAVPVKEWLATAGPVLVRSFAR